MYSSFIKSSVDVPRKSGKKINEKSELTFNRSSFLLNGWRRLSFLLGILIPSTYFPS